MNWKLFLFRRWDDFTHWLDLNRAARFKPPKPKHAALTTKEMKLRLRDAISPLLERADFVFDRRDAEEMEWVRPHPLIGQDAFSLTLYTKYSPEILKVELSVGFHVPPLQGIAKKICGPLKFDKHEEHYRFASRFLRYCYRDSDRPYRRLPFPQIFTFWSVDFRAEEIEKLKQTILDYALPYYDRFRSLGDLQAVGKSVDNQAVLLVWLGETESALRFIDEELQKPKRYGPEMRARMECLRKSIESGQLLSLLAEQKGLKEVTGDDHDSIKR